MYDVIIIGAGVSGSASARELARYKANICVLEKEEDVCCATSKANSAIVHAGFDAMPGTLMAKLNVIGNKMMKELSEELDFHYKQNGAFVVCTDEETRDGLEDLYQRGIKNGVEGLRIVERDELVKMEPNISDEAVCALYAPTSGIVDPFNLNISMAENAATNGVEFKFNSEVKNIEKLPQGGFRVKTENGEYETKCVVNAAGVYADIIHNMVSDDKLEIIPRRGDYFLLDKQCGNHVKRTIFALPTKLGKGVLVSPTVDGNLIVGPTAIDIDDKEGTNTTQMGLDEVRNKCEITVKNVPLRQTITSFAGLRAHQKGHEFIIEELKEAPGFVDCAGIESPGLTSSPAIGIMVADIVKDILKLEKNPDFNGKREGIIETEKLSREEMNELIKKDKRYGRIICRCESITEGEIVSAINRPLGATTLDGVKRRVRAGAGRCQAGFCSPKVMEILARELKRDIKDITKSGKNSKLIVGINKDRI